MKLIGKGSIASFLRIILNVIWWMGITMFGMFVIFTLLLIIFGPPKGVQPPLFSLDAQFLRIEFREAVVKNPKSLFMSFMPFGLIMVSLGMAIVYQLRKIFATLVAGNPFLLENANRMRKIGIYILGGVVVELIAGKIIGQVIMENVVVKGVTFSIKDGLNLGGVFFGLVILILAEIFRQGALLKEEQDLTI